MKWWPGTESNRRRQPFQGCGLYFEGLSAPRAWLAPYSALRRSPERGRFWRSRDVWWPGTESNRRRQPFQGCALPTELPGHIRMGYIRAASVGPVKTLCVRNVIDYNNDVEFSQTGRQSSRPASTSKNPRRPRPRASVHGTLLGGLFSRKRKAWLGRSMVKDACAQVFPQRRAMFEAVA
jgi:hypothetical protein